MRSARARACSSVLLMRTEVCWRSTLMLAPQVRQMSTSMRFSAPHSGQASNSSDRSAPQCRQTFSVTGFDFLHWGQTSPARLIWRW